MGTFQIVNEVEVKGLILVLLLLAYNCFAANIYRDPSCKLVIIEDQIKEYPELVDTLKNHLSDKDFQPITADRQGKMPIGTLHLNFSKKMTGDRLYPHCEITIDIKKSEHTHLAKSDKTIFRFNAKRSFPRLTFEGTYRCKKAIRDALYSLPYCRGPAN